MARARRVVGPVHCPPQPSWQYPVPAVVQARLCLGSDQYLALNPNGRIPPNDDEGQVLWESNAVVHYRHISCGL